MIAERAADGSDAHYAKLAAVATVTQLRNAIKLEPRPATRTGTRTPPRRSPKPATSTSTTWKITLPKLEAANFDAALHSHRDALITAWKRDHDDDDGAARTGRRYPAPPMRSCGWSKPAGMPRPPAARTGIAPPWWCMSTSKTASPPLHLGPLLTDYERRYLTCDATCEVWFERDGQVIGPAELPG